MILNCLKRILHNILQTGVIIHACYLLKAIIHLSISDLMISPDLLKEGDLIIRNDTKVIPARLIGKRSGGGKTEALLMHPAARSGEEEKYEEETGRVCWVCLAKPCNHLKAGKIVTFGDGQVEGRVERNARRWFESFSLSILINQILWPLLTK